MKKFLCTVLLLSNFLGADFYSDLTKKQITGQQELFHLNLGQSIPSSYYSTPLIGKYNPGGYEFLARIVYIGVMPALFNNVLPASISNAFQTQTGQAFNATDKRVFAQIVFYDNRIFRNPPQTYNLVFHHFLQWLTDKVGQDIARNLLIGVFDPDGVQAAAANSVSINALKQENVHAHNGGGYYSPDNVRFSTKKERSISTFWSMAFSPDKNTILVTFHVLANTNTATDLINDMLELKVKKNGKEVVLVDDLCAFIPALEHLANEFIDVSDQAALRSAARMLKNMLSHNVQQETADLVFNLCGLKFNCGLLQYKLEKLGN